MKSSLEAARDAAIRWLLHSGVRNADGPLSGSFNAWHDRTWGWAYSEVTGYGITLLCDLHERDPALEKMTAAVSAGHWLLLQSRSGRACRCRHLPEAGWLDHLCAFDNGMILNALCHLFRATGDQMWLEAAVEIANWLTDTMSLPDGGLVAKRGSNGGIPETPERWSSRTGPYQAKVSLGLAHLARCTGNGAHALAAVSLCQWALRFQRPDGRFVTDVVLGDTYLHAHCYVVEGLLATAALTGSQELVAPAMAALEWMRSAETTDGGLSRRFNAGAFEAEEHADSTAQGLRLLALAGTCTDRIQVMASRFLELQCLDGDPSRHGGFRYGRRGTEFTHNVTTHGTIFAIQVLDMCLRGTAGFDWASLV